MNHFLAMKRIDTHRYYIPDALKSGLKVVVYCLSESLGADIPMKRTLKIKFLFRIENECLKVYFFMRDKTRCCTPKILGK